MKGFYKEIKSLTRIGQKGKIIRGLTDEDGVRIADESKELLEVKTFYEDLLKEVATPPNSWNEIHNAIERSKTLIPDFVSKEEVELAIKDMNLNKSCGNNYLYPHMLKDERIRERVAECLTKLLNSKDINLPAHWKETRLVLLAKNDKEFAHISNTRPIAVQQTETRVMEKMLLPNIKENGMMSTGNYQTGFKADNTTHMHASTLLQSIAKH